MRAGINMTQEVADYLRDKGLTVRDRERLRGHDNYVLDCPLCQKPWDPKKGNRPFYIRPQDGAWVTNCCHQQGTLYTLREQLGDIRSGRIKGFAPSSDPIVRDVMRQLRFPPQPEALKKDPTAVDRWCNALQSTPEWYGFVTGTGMTDDGRQRRALSMDSIQMFRLGLAMAPEAQGGSPVPWLVIPYVAGGKVVMVKKRTLAGKKTFRRWPAGVDAPLFNVDALAVKPGEPDDAKTKRGRVYITEGELDAISLTQMGFVPAVSLPNGAKDLTDAHAAFLEPFDEIAIATDNDENGDRSAALIAKRLGLYRCVRVKLPLKDANACLSAGLIAEVQQAVDSARGMGGGVVTLADAWEAATREQGPGTALERGHSTGFEDLDLVIGGIRLGEWSAVTGDTGAGKTVFMLSLLSNIVVRNVAGLLIGPELTWQANAVRMGGYILDRDPFTMESDDRASATPLLRSVPMYLVERQGHLEMAEVEGWIEYTVRRHGVQIVVLDHLDYLLKDVDDFEEVNRIIQRITALAAKLLVHIVLGVHPKSVETDSKTSRARKIGMNDIRGGPKIKQNAHNIMILDYVDQKTGISVLRVEKRRWAGNRTVLPAKVPLRFDPLSGKYKSAPLDALFDQKLSDSKEAAASAVTEAGKPARARRGSPTGGYGQGRKASDDPPPIDRRTMAAGKDD